MKVNSRARRVLCRRGVVGQAGAELVDQELSPRAIYTGSELQCLRGWQSRIGRR